MARRSQPIPTALERSVTVASRLTEREREIIRLAAQKSGTDVSSFLYGAAMREAARLRVFDDGGNQRELRI